jgi:hypothetical protein
VTCCAWNITGAGMADSAVRDALGERHPDAATPSLPALPRVLSIHIPEGSEMRDQRELSPRVCALDGRATRSLGRRQ